MLPAAHAGSLLPGAPTGAPGGAPGAGAGLPPLPVSAAVTKGAGLISHAFQEGGAARLGLREVRALERPELWALADAAAGAPVPRQYEGLIESADIYDLAQAGPDLNLPLFWDLVKRRFSAVGKAGGFCGQIASAAWRLAITDHFDAAFAENGDGTGVINANTEADYQAIRNRRVKTRHIGLARPGAARKFRFNLPSPAAAPVAEGDVVTLFAETTLAANETEITTDPQGQFFRDGEALGNALTLVPSPVTGSLMFVTVRAEGGVWVRDPTPPISATAVVSALQGPDPAPEVLYDGYAADAAFIVLSNSDGWQNTERVAFTRALTPADDGRMLEIVGEYSVSGNRKYLSLPRLSAEIFRTRMAAITGRVAESTHALSTYIQRPSNSPGITGWSEAVLHVARWQNANTGVDGLWFNAGSGNNLPDLHDFRVRVTLR